MHKSYGSHLSQTRAVVKWPLPQVSFIALFGANELICRLSNRGFRRLLGSTCVFVVTLVLSLQLRGTF